VFYLSLSDTQVKEMTVGLFLQESERDKQHKVGASQISDPCTRHLAHALVRTEQEVQKYWMGGKIGTAIHGFIERAIADSGDVLLDGAIVEQKIRLGVLDGYGTISSKPDLVLPGSQHLIDWKTTSRTKIKKLQNFVAGLKHDSASEYTLRKYIGQAQLYAWGLNQGGTKIDKVTLVFINRDGTYENDIWTFSVDYDEEFALQLWNRLETLWSELQDGAHPESYAPHPDCYKCSIGI
jgi:CRISPR/Cas system-associated exonuclease Cas4 (RecB family)